MTQIYLIGAPVDCGSPQVGCVSGPAALRQAGIASELIRLGHQVIDGGDLPTRAIHGISHQNPAISRLTDSAGWVQTLQQATRQLAGSSVLPIFLGGDHLLAAGTIPPLCAPANADPRPLFVLWLDAHADFHTLTSTQSGNLHGTPAAYVCGQGSFDGVFPPLAHPLDPARLCQVGVRSIDRAEHDLLARLPTRLVTMSALNEAGPAQSLQPFLDSVIAANGRLHLSFDIDCLDPSVAPGVGTAVENGISLAQAGAIMSLVRDCQRLSSVDIAELNPQLDTAGQSARAVVQLMAVLFGPPGNGSGQQNQSSRDDRIDYRCENRSRTPTEDQCRTE
ncbi:MAG: arginase [Burkholderiaceae bacterium]